MSGTAQYAIGTEVRCQDGEGDGGARGKDGRLARVVLDPVRGVVTHLVVEPASGPERLVPVGLVAAQAGEITLSCDAEGLAACEAAEETEFLPGGGTGDSWGYAPGELIVWPYFSTNSGIFGMGGGVVGVPGYDDQPTSFERVPAGEVQIRRGERVEASDGETGRVYGLVVDEKDQAVTHILVHEGHLWGRKKVAVPMSVVKHVGDTVQVDLTKAELHDLPEARADAEV